MKENIENPSPKNSNRKIILILGILVIVCCTISIISALIIGGKVKKSVGRVDCYETALQAYNQKLDAECDAIGEPGLCTPPAEVQDQVYKELLKAGDECAVKFPE